MFLDGKTYDVKKSVLPMLINTSNEFPEKRKELNVNFCEVDNIMDSNLHKDKLICKNYQINLRMVNNKGDTPNLQ